jgi:hypothetical protein
MHSVFGLIIPVFAISVYTGIKELTKYYILGGKI